MGTLRRNPAAQFCGAAANSRVAGSERRRAPGGRLLRRVHGRTADRNERRLAAPAGAGENRGGHTRRTAGPGRASARAGSECAVPVRLGNRSARRDPGNCHGRSGRARTARPGLLPEDRCPFA